VVLTVSMQIFKTKQSKKIFLPIYSSTVHAGFPSPADDYMDAKIDLNEHFISRPSSTFLACVEGDSMTGVGIIPKDYIIVDRSEPVKDGSIVLATIDSEFTLKRYRKIKGRVFLIPENPKYQPIEIKGEMQFEVWGVVVGVTRKLV
jgi:DNA polymerase V